MTIDDGKRIEEDDVVLAERDPLFFRIEIFGAKETGTFGDRFRIHCRRRTSRTMRNVPDENVEPINTNCSRLRVSQTFDAASKPRPSLDLVFKQLFDYFDHPSACVLPLPGLDLHSSNPVFVTVVPIHHVQRQGAVRITLPPT